MVGLKLSIPVFNAFDTRNKIRRAKASLMDTRLVMDDRKLQLRKNIEQAYYNALTAQKKYAAETKSETANSISYKYAEKKYESGRSTIFDLNQSRQMWFTASENALRAKYEFLIRKKILDIYAE
jgi:outer membrane protein